MISLIVVLSPLLLPCPVRCTSLSRAIGRIVGQGGKTRHAIENATRTRIVVADQKIHILGSFSNIKVLLLLCSWRFPISSRGVLILFLGVWVLGSFFMVGFGVCGECKVLLCSIFLVRAGVELGNSLVLDESTNVIFCRRRFWYTIYKVWRRGSIYNFKEGEPKYLFYSCILQLKKNNGPKW